MTPYLVTTKRRLAGRRSVPTLDAGPQPFGTERFDVFRRAVATLEEAQQEAALVIGARRRASDPHGNHEAAWPEWDDPALYALRTAESGGTVGPLPDGTAAVVEPTTYLALVERMRRAARRLPWRPQDTAYLVARAEDGDEWAQRRVLDAYNDVRVLA